MQPDVNTKPIIYLAIELSATSWFIASRQPTSEKIGIHRIDAGDCDALLTLIEELRRKATVKLNEEVIVASCFEAGRRAELDRLHRRLVMTLDMIREIESKRQAWPIWQSV